MRHPLARLLVAAAVAVVVPELPAQQPGRTITGVVQQRDAGTALARARIDVPALGVERFTGVDGSFAIHGVAPGTYRIRARFVGYAPGEVTVTVPPGDAPVPPVRIELARLPVRLAAVRVTELRECRTPGPPDPTIAPDAAVAVEEMRENARRYRLLVAEYPFTYWMSRSFVRLTTRGPINDPPEQVPFQEDLWRYAPGNVVLPGGRAVRVPTIAQLADSTFVATHCFAYAGHDTLGGATVARIDFLPDRRIRTPDVRGWIALDPDTYQIRGTVLQLTNPSRADRTIRELRITTYFADLAPGLPVFARIVANRRLQNPPAAVRDAPHEVIEEQVLQSVNFHGVLPPGVGVKPR